MFKKIITYFIMLAVVLPIFATVIPFGGGVKTAYAAAEGKEMVDPCDLNYAESVLRAIYSTVPFGLGDKFVNAVAGPQTSSVWHCALFTATWIAYSVGLKGSVLIAGWASDLFNLSIQFSLSSKIFDAKRNPMIEIGWTMVRDLFNLIFIFILLYAAISTILQYGNMDIKKILPGLIIAALLVNFSLMISKVVIDASHVFSFAFYERINTTDNGRYAEFKSAVEVNEGFKKKNLADVFLAGFNPQSLLTGTMSEVVTKDEKGNEIKTEKNTESQWYQVVAEATKKGDKFMDVIWKLFMIIGLESALAIFSAFILIVVASMFVVRIVVLWMLMIFSPIAFLGFILPNMNKYSKKWWDTLISQSFFAPAFMFMFMLSTEFVNSKIMQGMLNITPNDATKMAIGMDGGGIVTVIFNFLIIGALMWFSLSTAKSMGGYSAEFAQKGRGLILGGANKMLWKPLSRNTVGRGFDMMAKSDSIQKIASRFPILGGGIYKAMKKGAGVGGYDQVMEDKIKLGKGLKDAKLRAQYFNNIDARSQKEWYSKASARERVELHELSKNKKLDEYFKALSTEEQEKTIKAKTEVALKKENIDLARTFVDAISSGDINLQKEIMDQIKDTRKPGFIKELESVIPQAQRELLTAATSGKEGSIANSILEVNPLWAATAPAGSPPGTSSRRADFLSGFSGKPGKARNLTSSARQDRDVIRSFTPQHLEDLIKNGNLSDVEAEAIQNEVLTAPSNDPWSAKMVKYMSTGPSKDFWSTI